MLGALSRQRCDRAAGHGGEDLDRGLPAEVALGPEEAHVLAIDEHVHEAAERAVAEHARTELGVLLADRLRERAHARGLDGDRRVPAGRGAERRRKPDGEAHASCLAYAARNASASGAMTGPSVAVTAPLYALPVT